MPGKGGVGQVLVQLDLVQSLISGSVLEIKAKRSLRQCVSLALVRHAKI